MGVCCLHICQERGNYGEKMSAVDLNDGDTTESFVDLSESDETVQEKEQLLQECQTEQVQMQSEQEPDPSRDITCDYKTEGSQRNEGLAYREEKQSQEPKEPGKDTGYRETQETITKDGQENSPEDDYSNTVPYTPGEMLGPQEDAEYDNGMLGEANQETQTEGDGYGSPQETPSGGSQDEAVEEHNATLSNKPEPHVSQDDKGGSMASKKFKEGNFQETTSQMESAAVHTEEAMGDLQEVKAKKELHDNQTDEGIDEESLDRKGTSPDDHLEEQKMTMHERDQEQTGRTRDNMSDCTCEEQPVEPLQLKTEGSDWSQSLWTSKVNGVVTLRMEKAGPAAMSPVTVPQFFSDMVKKHGQKVALYARMANEWKGVTYSQYEQQSRTMAKAFLKLGLERFHAVLILGSNSPEWFMADIAAILAGGLAVGIDPLSNASFCLKVALDSQAQIVLVDDHNQLEKILKIKDKLRKLKAIVQWRGPVMEPSAGVSTWNQLLDLGSEVDESSLDDIMADQKPNQCCAVMYSTDEAGEPRGAMMSHDNVTWTSRALQETLGLGSEEVVVSYLSLSSMSVQLFDLWLILSCGGSTFFTEPAAWKRSLVSTLCDVRPTLFLGFPGLWEKVKKRWMLVEKKASVLQKMTISWARKKGLESYTSSGLLPWGHSLAEHVIFTPARMALGLDRCALCYVGTEPISQNVAEYFRSLGIDVLELYGKEETSGLQSLMLPSSRRTGRVELAGCKSREYKEGLSLWGRNVFLGYLGMEQMTSEAFTEDGWFITGRPQPLKVRNEDPEDLYLEL